MNPGSTLAGFAGMVGRAFARAFRALFGHWQWSAPPWIAWTGARSATLGRYAAARPGLTVGTIGVLAALVLAGAFGWQWWKTRPKPVTVDFKVTAPARTDLENAGKPNPLVVEFAKGVAPLALVNKEVTDGITVEPKLVATWHWRSDRVLELVPKDDWPVGTTYHVTLAKNAVAPQIRLENSAFDFSSPPFVAKIVTAEFYQDPRDAAQKKAVVSLNFSHPVDPATLEKRISLRMADASTGVLGIGAETTPFTLTYDKLKLNAFVHSQTLPIPKERSKLIVTVDKGVGAARGGPATSDPLTQGIDVPGIYSLAVNSVSATSVTNDRYGVEQVLVLGTTSAVNEKDMRKAIEAWVLPVYAPGTPEEKRTRPKVWGNPAEVTAAVLQAGTKLDLEPIPAERENTEVHTFRYRADVGRYVYVRVDKGLRSFGGYLLPARAQSIQRVPPFPPDLRILSQGALLSLSGEKKVAMMVRDLPGVRIEIGRVLPGQLQHLVSQSNGDFATPSFDGSFGPDNLSERFERKVPLPNLERGKAHYEAIDFSEYLRKDGDDRRGIFLLSVSSYDPEADKNAKKKAESESDSDEAPSDEEGDNASDNDSDNGNRNQNRPLDRNDKRLIVVTDLGVIVKRELDGSQVAFVQSIKTGQPVPGVTVDVIAKNGTTLYSQTTDAAGMTRFPRLDGLTRERAALMYVVHKAGDASFLPIARGDRMLDFSRFDIGGVANARQGGQLDAYLFSDRGIYRPGDTLHIGMIVKAADWTKPQPRSVAGLPLVAEVVDARGLTVRRENVKLAAGGFNELTYATLDTAPTGAYAINLYTVKDGQPNEQIGTLQVRVQEFEPDRMKVVARLSSEVADGWVSPADLKARVNAQNLFGTPAENRRVEATLTLSPAFPAFRGYGDYSFYDPQRAKEGYSEKLPDGKTDVDGNAEFDLGLSKYARATYRLHLLARAFEAEGGRSVAAETAALVSELSFLVGFKADGDLGYVSRGAKRDLTLIAIDPSAKKTAAASLTLQLIDRRYVSVLTKQDNGTYKYQSRRKDVVLKETPLSIPATGMTMAVNSETPGDFAYSIRNADGLEMNRIEYSVIGKGNVTRSLDRNAELAVVLDKKDYAPGDDIEVSIRAPYTGAGLITIERDKVYAQQWFKADAVSSVQKIRLPKDFEGNGYVNVQFVRDPASDEIFMSPLTYGVAPFAVSRAKRTNTLTLAAPELVKPGQTLKIKLGVQQPTRAVLFAVDEGILQVARYQNADPLGHYFQKRALEVRTAQILDLILPEFKKLMAAAAPGGDEAGALGRHLNPFKRKRDPPAVYWSGIVEVTGEREFSYKVPDTFNGTLRVMAVAINDTMMGAAARKSLVRGDFVLSPNTPAMVAPGDEFDVSVGVANNIQGSGANAPIAVTLAATPHLEVVGSNTQTLPVGEMREGVALFRLKARDGANATLGSATLTFTATLNGKSTALATDVSVRPATPYYTRLAVGSFTSSVDVPTTRDLFPEHRTLEASVSPLPLVAAQGLTAYLANFAHSCTEQLVSQAMPAVVLGKRPEFARAGSNVPQKTLASAVDVLRTRQNAEGGFGLWAASVEADEYASVYATHLLLEARERGQNVPYDMLQKALDYLQQLAASPPTDLRGARSRAYAAYLLTRQGTVTTPMLTGIREMLDAKYPKQWQNDSVAAFLAASYLLMKQDKLASTLIEGPVQALVSPPKPFRYEYYYDPLIRDTQALYLISRHFPDRARSLPPEVMLRMTERLAENQFNTLSAAYTILALDAYASTLGPQAFGKLSIAELDAKGNVKPLELPANLVPRVAFSAGTAKLRFGIDSNVRAYYAVTEAGFDRVPPPAEQRNGIEVIREYVDAAGKPLKTIKLGDEVMVRLRFRAIDRDAVPNLALVDLLPGGFEPVIAPPPPPPEANTNDGDQEEAPRPAWVNRVAAGGNWNAEYADIRDDRVVLYGTALKNATDFVYKIKATNVGTFTAPPAYGESLYERSVQARSTPSTIVVEKPGR